MFVLIEDKDKKFYLLDKEIDVNVIAAFRDLPGSELISKYQKHNRLDHVDIKNSTWDYKTEYDIRIMVSEEAEIATIELWPEELDDFWDRREDQEYFDSDNYEYGDN